MAFIAASDRNEFLQIIDQRLQALVEPAEREPLALFARSFFGIATLDELLARQDSDLLGALLSGWRMLARLDGERGSVHVVAPQVQCRGWHAPHTVVQLLHLGSPFLVVPVRVERSRQGHAIHALYNRTFMVDRDADG